MWIELERESPITLSRQVYRQIRQMILNGGLASGSKLPSTRSLASDLSVSRNTVIEAYGQLIAEGYLQTRTGSGTVVAVNLRALDIAVPIKRSDTAVRNDLPPKNDNIDFRTGIPALEYFPRKEWGKLYAQVCDTIPASGFGYCGVSGIWELRAAIAHYLYRVRGISC